MSKFKGSIYPPTYNKSESSPETIAALKYFQTHFFFFYQQEAREIMIIGLGWMQMKRVLAFLAEDLFLLSVLDVKIIDRGLFFNHLRPGASTGRPGRRLIDEKTQKEESRAGRERH